MQNRGPNPAFIGGNLPLIILGFLLGILAYFAIDTEPRVGDILPLSIGGFVLGLVALWSARAKTLWATGWFLVFLAAAAAGFTYSTYRTSLITNSAWPDSLAAERVWLKGTVTAVNLRSNGFATVHLKDITTYHPDRLRTWPSVVLITHNSRAQKAAPGGIVTAQARLKPPSAPLHQSEYDWRQRSFFERVSATGLVMGGFYVTPPAYQSFKSKVRDVREDIAHKYGDAAKKQSAGGVAAALLTGIRSQIPPQVREHYAQSGLAHLMAISGMHLGMVAGFVYLFFRFALVHMGSLALRADIRKTAALAAFLAAVAYAILAGTTIPTLRALSLIGAALLAILFHRVHLGIRILALIALALALYSPYWVAGPSFQLSFVASFSLLLWAYNRKRLRIDLGPLAPKPSRVADLFKASLVAALATGPVVAMHFGTVPVMSVVANMLGVPFLGLAILPLGFLSLLVPEWLLGGVFTSLYLGAVTLLNNFAGFIAEQPASSFQMPPEGLPLFFVASWGMLLAFIYRRFAVFLVALLALIPVGVSLRWAPDVVALYHPDGTIVLEEGGYILYTHEGQANRDLEHLAEVLSKNRRGENLRLKCVNGYCVYKTEDNNPILTYAKPWADISGEDCAHTNWVLTRQSHIPCPGKNLAKLLAENNPTATYTISIKKGRVLTSAFRTPSGRPWHH